MANYEANARRSILEACVKLCDLGLVERTWGNISARLDDEYFLITPSGTAYESLNENKLVKVRIDDLSYCGDTLPSSEKGVHAAIYAARNDVNFIVHTHQNAATVCSISGNDLNTANLSALGDITPCAAYARPSTEELADSVYEAVVRADGCKAALMRNHGAVCFAESAEGCFETALQLEEFCTQMLAAIPVTLQLAAPLGCSSRNGDGFVLTKCGDKGEYNINNCANGAAQMHSSIYENTDAQFIIHCAAPAVINASVFFECMPAYVDDFAQIIGENVLCCNCVNEVAEKAKNRNAVFFKGEGALCYGSSLDDCKAAASILEKNCLAALYARTLQNCPALSDEDSSYLRGFYIDTYSKRMK